ncbi:MAG: metallophosphoesterase [Chloroflexi bacterium]|nr:metallophosphoesterase [Chloroflexota bacterium]
MVDPLITFVHISDLHLPARTSVVLDGRPNAHASARAVIAQVNALPFPVELVLITGDVGHDPGHESDYLAVKSTVSQFLPKFYVMAGNHDRSKWLHHVVMGRVPDTYYYAFQANGVQFACLDSSVKNSHHGKLGEDQLAWLDALVSIPSDQPLVVALHHHPIVLGSQSMDSIRLTDGEALHRILLKARHRIRCVLFGHIHESVTIIRDGITYASTHSTWFQSRSWHGQDDFQKDVIHTPGFNVVTLMPNGDTFIRAFRAPVG